MDKVYISGKITGDEEAAIERFYAAEWLLSSLGYTPINPLRLEHTHDKRWESYMRVCIKALCDCDYIYLIDGWELSKGAVLEYNIAMSLGIEVIEVN